jgi:hypothetical protein
MKTVIGGTDFMSGGGWFTLDDHPGDTSLKFFTIARPRPHRRDYFHQAGRQVRQFRPAGSDGLRARLDALRLSSQIRTSTRNTSMCSPSIIYAMCGTMKRTEYSLTTFLCSKSPAPIPNPLHRDPQPAQEPRWPFVRTQRREDEAAAGGKILRGKGLAKPTAPFWMTQAPENTFPVFPITATISPSASPLPRPVTTSKNSAILLNCTSSIPDLPLWMTGVCHWDRGTP